jgi:hypothetical protein
VRRGPYCEENTIVFKRKRDGSLVEVLPDGSGRPRPPTDWSRLDAMTEEIEAAAMAAAGRSLMRRHGATSTPEPTLLDQGCEIEADVVPIVAKEVPDLPRPLKNWGAPWLVRESLAARDQRLGLPPAVLRLRAHSFSARRRELRGFGRGPASAACSVDGPILRCRPVMRTPVTIILSHVSDDRLSAIARTENPTRPSRRTSSGPSP